jgi:hypothetical protein
MIEARNLSKSYGETVAVDDLSFAVEGGQVRSASPCTKWAPCWTPPPPILAEGRATT